MASREQVEELVADWKRDPCYDLDSVPGFEAYREELRTRQRAQEAAWKAARELELEKLAAHLGVPGNLQLAREWSSMQIRVRELERRLEEALERAMAIAR